MTLASENANTTIGSTDPHPRERIELCGTHVSYVDVGANDPIVFLHGNPTSSYLWRNVIPHVSDLGRCLAPDLIGMGASGAAPDNRYRFVDHVRYLDAWFDALDLKDVTLVVHDWGSAIGFHWAARNPDRVKAIAYMEAIVQPRQWSDFPPGRDGLFRAMRSDDGERLVLDENFFVETVLPKSVLRSLAEEEMDHYRAPFRSREARVPTLVFPRELPIDGEPADVAKIVDEYGAWLAASSIPKLLVSAQPGAGQHVGLGETYLGTRLVRACSFLLHRRFTASQAVCLCISKNGQPGAARRIQQFVSASLPRDSRRHTCPTTRTSPVIHHDGRFPDPVTCLLVKIGLFAINYGTCADPNVAVRVAQHAEEAGFESVWTAEHIVLPDPQPPGFSMPPTLPFLDTIVALTLVATHTATIRVATGIIVLPLRNPAVLAKELASVDVISSGRLIAGFAAGYIPAEFAASGVSMAERGARMDEYLQVLKALWAMENPRHDGRFVSIRNVDAQPRPIQQPGPPIVVGGEAPAALRRAVTMANGWYGFAITPTEAGEYVAALRRLAQEHERPATLGRLELTVTPAGPLDRATIDQYRELGIDRLVLLPEPGAEYGRRHEPVPVDRILHNIDAAAEAFTAS